MHRVAEMQQPWHHADKLTTSLLGIDWSLVGAPDQWEETWVFEDCAHAIKSSSFYFKQKCGNN